MAQVWDKDAVDKTHLLELRGKAEDLIDDAETELKDYAEYIEEVAKETTGNLTQLLHLERLIGGGDVYGKSV